MHIDLDMCEIHITSEGFVMHQYSDEKKKYWVFIIHSIVFIFYNEYHYSLTISNMKDLSAREGFME